jgi:hypothetical protein
MISVGLLVGAVAVLIAIIINFVVTIKSFKSYSETKLTQTLLFGVTAMFIALAMTFLLMEKLFLTASLLNDPEMGLLFGAVAIVLSGCAVVSIDAFSFNMVFPKKFALLTSLAAVYMAIYLLVWLFDPTRTVFAEEIIFGPFSITPVLGYAVVIPLLIIPQLVFFYYAIKIQSESPTSSKRAWTLGIGVLVFTVGYVIEIMGIEDEIIITIARTLFIVASLLLYWGLFRIRPKE